MPAKTKKQQRFMAMCEHNPGAAKGKCPPKSVAKEFSHMAPSEESRKKLKSLGR